MTSHFSDDPPAHVQSIIESICELGCDRVNEIIDVLERGNSVDETRALDKSCLLYTSDAADDYLTV